MITVNLIRENPDKIKQNIINRGFDTKKADVDKFLLLDKEKNTLQSEVDNLRARRNVIAQKLQSERTPELIEEGRNLKVQVADLEEQLSQIANEWQRILDWMPNLALDGVPIGKNETENIEVKGWSKEIGDILNGNAVAQMTKPAFTIKPHWEIGKALDILDLETGAKVSGSRFYYLKKEGYLMAYGIFDLLLKKILADGFMPMDVPILVRQGALYGSSHFPADQDQVYKLNTDYLEEDTQLYLIGSSEPSLFAYYQDRLIENSELPIKMMALTPCFRSEAGSWGKDVRGMKRAHQFMKLEMDVIMEPDLEKAITMHEYLLSINEWLLQLLEIPYHVINMCTGDLGYAAAAKKYDVEVWLPSSQEWMETMSDSITTDFQSRRMNIKTRDAKGDKQFVYTLNDTGATHRLLIAILDHYQLPDGSLKVPTALQPYLNKEVISANQ